MRYNHLIMIEKFLEELGLTDKEVKVYLALLEVDSDSVIDLSKKTGISRTTIYPVLEGLSLKGLVSEVKVDKKVRYAAESPERLETYVERRMISLEEQEKRLKDIIPQLKSKRRESGERPVIKYYEGEAGAFSTADELFSRESDEKVFYALYSKDLLDEVFPEKIRKKYISQRVKKNLTSKAVCNDSQGKIKSDTTGTRVVIDDKKYPITCDIGIYGDTTRITTLGNRISSILITSQDFANTMKSMLQYVQDSKE